MGFLHKLSRSLEGMPGRFRPPVAMLMRRAALVSVRIADWMARTGRWSHRRGIRFEQWSQSLRCLSQRLVERARILLLYNPVGGGNANDLADSMAATKTARPPPVDGEVPVSSGKAGATEPRTASSAPRFDPVDDPQTTGASHRSGRVNGNIDTLIKGFNERTFSHWATRLMEMRRQRRPEDPTAIVELSQVLMATGQLARARDVLQQGLEANSNHGGVQLAYVDLCYRIYRVSTIVRSFSLRFDSGIAAGTAGLFSGELDAKSNRDAAMDTLSVMLDGEPKSRTVSEQCVAALRLALIHLADGDVTAARSALDKTLQIHERVPHAHFLKGRIAEKDGDDDAAISHYARAAKLNPKFAKAHARLGHLYLAKGDVRKSARHFNERLGGGSMPIETLC